MNTQQRGFAELVAAELESARAKHPAQNSLHEGYAVILEELDEVWDEVKRRQRDKGRLLAELVQVAAMCQRCAEDNGLLLQADEQRGLLLRGIIHINGEGG